MSLSRHPLAPDPAVASVVSRSTTGAVHSAKVFDNLVTLCVLAASLAYCAADARPELALVTVTTAGIAWAMRRAARARGRPTPNLPGLAVNVLVLVTIVRAAWHVLRGQSTGNAVVSDLSEFLIVIQLIKLFDRRTARDDVQLLALTLFVAIGAILTANSLLVGALIFVYTPMITGAAMALQIDVGLRRLAGSPVSRGAADSPGRARDFRRTVALAVIGSLMFASLAFVLLPRGLGRNTLGRFGQVAGGSTVGFTDTIRLGQAGFLKPDDPTPVLDVAVFDSEDRNIGDQMRALHLRGSVSNTYNRESRTWDQQAYSETEQTSEPATGETSPYGVATQGPGAFKQVVTMRSTERGRAYLFSLWRPTKLEWDADTRVTVYTQTLVFERNRGSGQFRYTVWSELDGDVTEGPAWVPPTFATGKIRDKAVEILSERKLALEPSERKLDDNRAAAAAFQAYLRENATYTLVMEAPPAGQDPIDYFIFDRRRGHGEYFASALVAMCQSVGIPARLALGYLATEYNEVTGQFLVRASNAHAWAEVRIAPGRWVTFDPSPPADIEQIHAPATGVLARIRRAYEAIDFAWNSLIVSFDEQRRSSLLSSGVDFSGLRERLSGVKGAIEDFVKAWTGGWASEDRLWKRWLYGVGAAMVLVGLGHLLWRQLGRLRVRGRGRGLGGSDPLASDLHRMLLRELRRANVPKPAHTPPLAHARSLAGMHPRLAGAAAAVAEAVYRSRFAGTPMTRERWRTLRRELEGAAAGANERASGKSG